MAHDLSPRRERRFAAVPSREICASLGSSNPNANPNAAYSSESSMASCDDDFDLLGDEAQSQHQPRLQAVPFSAPHRYLTAKAAPIPCHHLGAAVPSAVSGSGDKRAIVDGGGGDHEGYGEAFVRTDASKRPGASAFQEHHCFPDDADPFSPHQLSKRNDRDDLSDGGSPYGYNGGSAANKKARPMPSSGDYRKDREEWSDTAIGSLLDAYTERYEQLNRGNLRGRDWEDVASIVSERCNKRKAGKSVEQCKNKIDNLKKRYKVEYQRLSSGGLPNSHWPWFKKMEHIVGSSSSSKANPDDDKFPTVGGPAAAMRQIKRYPVAVSSPVWTNNNSKLKSLPNPQWKRVILKISGMALAGHGSQNVDPKVVMLIAKEVAIANRAGIEVAIVIGGRNFFCADTWIAATGTDRLSTYPMGMVASLMNAIMLQASLEKLGVVARVQSTLTVPEIAEPYIRRRAIHHLKKGRVIILNGAGAGTGNPLFNTDTTAVLRASELHADAILKGTTVHDAYNYNSRNSNSSAFEHISFRELLSRGFTSMDMIALNFCEENNIPVILFNLLEPGNISKALCGDQVGSLIDQSARIG